jgi:hypothetical protein
MSLFVVVARNKRDGKEYLLDKEPEGYTEYVDAKRHLDEEAGEAMDHIELYVGRVVDVQTPVGEPRTLADLS